MSDLNAAKRTELVQVSSYLSQISVELLNAGRQTADPVILMKINNEATAIGTMLNQIAQAVATLDDALFKHATAVIKTQIAVLQGLQDHIHQLINDAVIAGRVLGYVAQAVAIILAL